MIWIDWLILVATLLFTVVYGIWKTRNLSTADEYFRGNNQLNWATVGLSVMATQASAITFLSTTGQAYQDGMRFVQFYFGLPIAMVILCVAFVPYYFKLKVYTAYEFLEQRFDLKTRLLAAGLFLVQRGLAAGITIVAPSIFLSAIFGWDLVLTNVITGALVVLYTLTGGSTAVAITQKQQMLVMLGGLVLALVLTVFYLPKQVDFIDALSIAGTMGKMNVVDFSFDWNDRYTFWSGITGGLFLALSYFGTDQSQVARYLSGKSISEIRMGLLFNGLLKVPVQFFILLTGLMVFVFYQFTLPPIYFKNQDVLKINNPITQTQLKALDQKHTQLFEQKKETINNYLIAKNSDDKPAQTQAAAQIQRLNNAQKLTKEDYKATLQKALPDTQTKDSDYVFLTFILKYMPNGVIGLLLAMIFCAAMSSISSELNALATTSVIDFYKRLYRPNQTGEHYVLMAKWFTALWGAIAIGATFFVAFLDNLIQAVNIIGSLFYGTILGIFLVAFYFKSIRSNAVFWSAIATQITLLGLYQFTQIAFLWYNVIGCLMVIGLGMLLSLFQNKR